MAGDYQRLYRSRTARMFAGVCGGIGEYFHIDPTVVRLGFVLLAFVTGFVPMLLFYLIVMLVVPDEPLPG